MNKTVEAIANFLLEDKFFEGFKLRKKDLSLIKKSSIGYEIVELQNWVDMNSSNGEKNVVIHPLYLKRFDVLHKWFEKFSFKTLSDQRGSYSVGFSGSMLNTKNNYHFPLSEDINSEWEVFKNDIITNAGNVFNKFQNIKDVYKHIVYPAVTGKTPLPDGGADWIFEYLLLTKLVDRDNYDNTKKVILERAEEMNKRDEPNIIEYYDKLDEILFYLETECSHLKN